MKKVIITMLCFIFMITLLSGYIATEESLPEIEPNPDWTFNQVKAHEIAEIARFIGLSEDHPIIQRAKEIWHEEDSSLKSNLVKEKHDYDEKITEAEKVIDSNQTEYVKPEFLNDQPEELSEVLAEPEVTKYTKGIENYTQEDIDYVACTVYNEGWCKTTPRHKDLIAAVIVNRVNFHKWFPNTVKEVIQQPNQYLPAYAEYGSYYMELAMNSGHWEECCEIAERALRGEIDCPENVVFQAEFLQGDGTYEIGYTSYSTTYFCYVNS